MITNDGQAVLLDRLMGHAAALHDALQAGQTEIARSLTDGIKRISDECWGSNQPSE